MLQVELAVLLNYARQDEFYGVPFNISIPALIPLCTSLDPNICTDLKSQLPTEPLYIELLSGGGVKNWFVANL